MKTAEEWSKQYSIETREDISIDNEEVIKLIQKDAIESILEYCYTHKWIGSYCREAALKHASQII